MLERVREPHDIQDQYAVAVKKKKKKNGNNHWRLSRVCSFFLRQEGTISCTVTGGEDTCRSVHRIALVLYCAQSARVIFVSSIIVALIIVNQFGELNFRCFLKYFNNEIFPNYGIPMPNTSGVHNDVRVEGKEHATTTQ